MIPLEKSSRAAKKTERRTCQLSRELRDSRSRRFSREMTKSSGERHGRRYAEVTRATVSSDVSRIPGEKIRPERKSGVQQVMQMHDASASVFPPACDRLPAGLHEQWRLMTDEFKLALLHAVISVRTNKDSLVSCFTETPALKKHLSAVLSGRGRVFWCLGGGFLLCNCKLWYSNKIIIYLMRTRY